MEEDWSPPTEPQGALVPPGRNPPTAVGAPALPPPSPMPPRVTAGERGKSFLVAVNRVLDAVDDIADRIAAGMRLRR